MKGRGFRARPRSPHLVGGYHWDCSDWCGGAGALPGISEVAGSERPDSSSPASPPSPPPPRSPPATPPPSPPPSPPPRPPLEFDTEAEAEAERAYAVHPDEYLPRQLRDSDAASLITMLEERHSLLGDLDTADTGSCGSLSARLCEIEDSDAEPDVSPAPAPASAPRPLHTDV